MNLSYAAAEYFIQALGQSSNFSIRYEYLINLIDQASKDVASYLNEECKRDLLLIFKKFPDVFIFNKGSVTLTDAFLSLYAFPSSINFSTHYKCFNAFDITLIDYFKLILSRRGPCNYFHLFNMLLTENGLQLASYFSHYNMTDMYMFFQTHADTFTILNDTVYLRSKPSLDMKTLHVDHKIVSHSMRNLTKSTYFLLTCFNSLHYIELRQCLCFVLSDVREYLNRYSLIKQRELFENVPETTMDNCGFLSLKNFGVSVTKSRTVRLNLLMVCVLAFEREMHFQHLIREVKNRASSDVNSILCGISVSEQFRFFRNSSELFNIGDDGYVRLLSSFVFPSCCFENSSLNADAQKFQSSVKSCTTDLQNMSINSPVASNFKTKSQDINTEYQKTSGNMAIASNEQMKIANSVDHGIQMNENLLVACDEQTTSSTIGRKITKYIPDRNSMQMKSADSTSKNLPVANIGEIKFSNSSSHLQREYLISELQIIDQRHVNLAHFINSLTYLAINPAILNIRLKISILYILQCFIPTTYKSVLKSVLHVLGDVRDSFISLFPAVQNAFVKECYGFIKVESDKKIFSNISSLLDMNEKEKAALVITCIIIKEGKLHFQKLADILISSKVNCLLSSFSISGQFKYFKTLSEYFNICGDGYITLNESFAYINAIVDSHIVSLFANCHASKMLSGDEQFDISSKSQPLHSSKNMGPCVTYNGCNVSKDDVKSSNKISLNSNNEISKLSNVSDKEIKVPVVIYKRLENAVFHLHSSFNPLIAMHALETFLHALNDVHTYFNNLITEDQHKFIEAYFQCINNDLSLGISPQSAVTFKEEEKVILLVTYLLIKEKSLHYQNIIKRLRNFKVKYSVCNMKVSKQFRYFKNLYNYFVIDRDGFVCLNSSFYSLRSIISSVSDIQSKINCYIQIKNQSLIYPSRNEASNISVQSPVHNIDTTVGFNESKISPSFKKEVSVDSFNFNRELVSMVTDYCFSILSACEKMKIINLCQRVNICHVKRLNNFFSFFTVSEKVNFFKNLSQYFDVSKDDFVSLKKGVKTSYITKSNLVSVRSNSVSESVISAGYSSNTESVNSHDVSELSETPSFESGASLKTVRLKIRRRNKRKSKQSCQNTHVSELQNKGKQKSSSKSEACSATVTCNDSFNKSEITYKSSSVSYKSKDTIKTVLCDKVIEKGNPTVASQNSGEKHKTNLCVKDSDIDKIPADVYNGKISEDIKLHLPIQRFENQDIDKIPAVVYNGKISEDIKLHLPGQRFENQKTLSLQKSNKLFNGFSNCANSSNGSMYINSNPESYPIGSFGSKVSDFNHQLNGHSENSENYNEIMLVGASDSHSTLGNNLNSKDVHDNSFESYGTELLNSFLGELELDLTGSAGSDQTTKQEKNQILDKQYSSILSDSKKVSKNSYAQSTVCDTLKTIPKPSDLFYPEPPKCNSKKVSDLSKTSFGDSENVVIELRAVNFFCTMLGKYEIGVSADFLIKHLNLASLQVQSFMFHYFQEDPLSFFLKHKDVFYVSPQTKNIYLIQNTLLRQ